MNIDGSADIEGGLFCWSPNGQYMAVMTSHSRLVVRDSRNLDVIFYEICSSGSAAARTSLITGEEVIIDKIGFSPDSLFVFASCLKGGITHVFQVQAAEPRWKAKITEGASGLSDIFFTPDSRHLLAFSELNIKLTLWSLVQKKVRYIKYPKNRQCVQFSKDGKYLGVVERRDGHDCLSIFSCSDWGLAHHFEIECSDCAEISWSPHGESICVWSTSLDFSCYVYSLDGHCLFNFVPQTFGLGISTSAWSPCGSILAIGSCDGKIRIFNVLNWALMSELPSLSNTIHHTRAMIFEEVEVAVRDVDLRIAKELMSRRPETQYKVVDKRPVQIVAGDRGRNVDHRALRSFKISEFKFSANSLYLAVKSESVPSTVFVYHVQGLTLGAVVINRFPVVSLDWGPVFPYAECLTILTSDGGLHVWSPKGALCLNLPDYDFESTVEQVHWNPMGKALALCTKDKVLCCKVGLSNILEDET